MAALEEISGIEGFIRRRVEFKRETHEQISEALQQLYPGTKGLSSRSVRRFCNNHNIHATSRLSPPELSRVVSTAVSQVLQIGVHIYCSFNVSQTTNTSPEGAFLFSGEGL